VIRRLERRQGDMGKNSCWKGLSRREMNLSTGTKTVALRRSGLAATGILAGLHPETRMKHSVSGLGEDPFRTTS
jgi:hypothetical protein